ncbi:hypothetical protein FFK22_039035 [Mycobacterium sp. KBS0706]|uniref:DUF6502 family protein n=1 Tax=Mycobacterium sp. KBS0706 TaxID=2578109 RepID=UPI00110F7832|nr:DUF6502 family protein [Mycobacterium sp. KBS0706]TSD83195.1 hypothetical protein FFK22_039035 [Mycobacterium sp. KBS0706]
MPPSHPLPPQALLKPLARLLRPLVRLLIRSGVTFPILADLLRGLYVDVAARDLLPDPKAQTDSRISLLTGVHRKEIRRLRTEPPAADGIPAVVTLGSQIIARWLGAPPYADADGPLPLPRTARTAGEASFEGLVESVTKDVRARSVLDDWIGQEIVSLDPEGRVQLSRAAFIPRPGGEEQLFYFARNLHDHIAAAAANVATEGPAPFFDRSMHYDRLRPETVAQLEATARDAAQQLLTDVNRIALAMAEADDKAAGTGTPLRRINLGVYVYVDDDSIDEETGP